MMPHVLPLHRQDELDKAEEEMNEYHDSFLGLVLGLWVTVGLVFLISGAHAQDRMDDFYEASLLRWAGCRIALCAIIMACVWKMKIYDTSQFFTLTHNAAEEQMEQEQEEQEGRKRSA